MWKNLKRNNEVKMNKMQSKDTTPNQIVDDAVRVKI
jgi:hypothetical protein